MSCTCEQPNFVCAKHLSTQGSAMNSSLDIQSRLGFGLDACTGNKYYSIQLFNPNFIAQ